jgi:diguanylate cyclase (GGDEF)-like protein
MNSEHPSDFRTKSNLYLPLAALPLLTPFSVNNFLQGRYFLGAGSLAIVLILAASASSITRDRERPWIVFFGLVPAIIVCLIVSIRMQGIIGVLWCYPAVISFYFMLPERKAWFANAALICVALPHAWTALDPSTWIRASATLLAVSVFSAIFLHVITRQQQQLNKQVVTDPLTGLSNRILLRVSLEQAIAQSARTGTPMTLLVLDMDRFKSINDTLGHDTGDELLRGIGELLRNRVRRSDKVFRLGGEEFLALLYDADAEAGRKVAEELRVAVETSALLPNRTVTASIGVATLEPGEDWKAWMKRGDENMYRAKAAGRNRVAA